MKEDRERILLYIMELIDRDDADYAKKTVKAFSVSLSTVYNYVAGLLKEEKLMRDPKKESGYSLSSEQHTFFFSNDGKLEEDRIFRTHIEPLLAGLPENVYDIWAYCFTEMMNNAIEHSTAKKISCKVDRNAVQTEIIIADNGIGIFKNIQTFLLKTTGEDVPEQDCAGYLLAGRFTTAKDRHSGEGVFFTSHMLDRFAIMSHGIVFVRDEFSDEQAVFPVSKKGTGVYMALSNHSKKTSEEVFDRFSDAENGFNKTEIPLAHLFSNGYPVSRSEARRLFGMIRKFGEVTLDFANIEKVGQAFVHEFFIILAPQNADQVIRLKNVSEGVQATISRVKKTV